MKHYFRNWINAVILCILAVSTSACGEDEDVINGPPWPEYPDHHQPILNIIVENEYGENLLNPSTQNSWQPGISWMDGNFYMVDMLGRKYEISWDEYYDTGSITQISDHSPYFHVRSLKVQTEPWQTWDVSEFYDKDYALAVSMFCKREILSVSFLSIKTRFSLYVPMREEPFVFEITGKYDDSTHLYSDLKILMDSQEQESQLIHLVIPSRPAQP